MAAIPAILLSYGLSSLIKSIQSFSITVTTTTNTATISSVTPANCTLIYSGQITTDSSAAGASFDLSHADVVFTNGTTITANKNTTGTYTITVNGWVIEWQTAAVVLCQRGTITLTAATSNTATITSAVTANTAVLYGGYTTNFGGSAASNLWTRLNLTNSTTVTATRGAATSNVTIAFEVLQFAAGILKSATQETTTTLTAAASANATISAVTMANTMVAFGGFSGTNSNDDRSKNPYAQLTSTTNIAVTRTSSTDNVTLVATAMEFNSGYIKSAQRGTQGIGSGLTTADATISSVSTTKTVVGFLGCSFSAIVTRNDFGSVNLALNSATTVRASRSASDTNTATAAYEAIEFN